jgi:hypothetical protein
MTKKPVSSDSNNLWLVKRKPKLQHSRSTTADLAFDEWYLFEDMTKTLRRMVLNIRQCHRQAEQNRMKYWYDLGDLMLEVEENAEDLYDEDSLGQLLLFFDKCAIRQGETARVAYQIRCRYSPDLFRCIVKMTNPVTGFYLTLEHLVELLRTGDDVADRLLRLTMLNSWSVKDLRNHVTREKKKEDSTDDE